MRISLSNQQRSAPISLFEPTEAYAMAASFFSTKSQNMFKTDGKSIRENYAILFKASSALTLMDFDMSFIVDAEKRVLKTIGLDDMCDDSHDALQIAY